MMPAQKPRRSKQDYETPAEFIRAVESRYGTLDVDLACTVDNKKADAGVFSDSLEFDWTKFNGNLWLNPPFGNIEPWVRKCHESASVGRQILVLLPASVGSRWFERWVFRKAYVCFLCPRMTFVGESNVFPKDLMLCIYGESQPGFDMWDWRKRL